MRIVGGAWRGRSLAAPPGQTTRPTADRARQALFDMLLHAPWAGREVIEGADVLDVFAGTGALGLEALSRGAASACFIEHDPAALRALRANIAACKAQDRTRVLPFGLTPGRSLAHASGLPPATLVFLDPPYGHDLVPAALAQLSSGGFVSDKALFVAETDHKEDWIPAGSILAERSYGAARFLIFRRELQAGRPGNAWVGRSV